jgi:hypothetical protein
VGAAACVHSLTLSGCRVHPQSQQRQRRRPLLQMLNDVYEVVCGRPNLKHMWAVSDWQQEFAAPANASLFAVPPDSQCPMVVDASTGMRSARVVTGFSRSDYPMLDANTV